MRLSRTLTKIMTLEPHIKSQEEKEENPDAPPVEYTQPYPMQADFGHSDDNMYLLGPIMGGLTDDADTFDTLFKTLRVMGFKDLVDIFPLQYDFRLVPDVHTAAFREYASRVTALMKGVPEDQPIMFVTFSMGSCVCHEVLRYIAQEAPELLGRIDNTIHMVSAEGGAVSSANALLLGDPVVTKLLPLNDQTRAMLESWGSWFRLFPSPIFDHKWLHVHHREGQHDEAQAQAQAQEQVTSFDSSEMSDMVQRFFPDEPYLKAAALMIEYGYKTWDKRLGELKDVYSKLKSVHCVDSEGVPTPVDLHLTVNEESRPTGRMTFSLEGDGTVPLVAQNLCRQLAAHTKETSFSTTYAPHPKEIEKIMRKAQGLFKRKGPATPQIFIDKLKVNHGSLGRHYDPVTKLLASAAVGMRDSGEIMGLTPVLRSGDIPKAQRSEAEENMKKLESAYKDVMMEEAVDVGADDVENAPASKEEKQDMPERVREIMQKV